MINTRLGKKKIYDTESKIKQPELEGDKSESDKDNSSGRMNVKGMRRVSKYAMKNLNKR